MKNIFKNNLFYPQNFFIKTNAYTDIDSIIKEISEEASVLAPECFDAETKYFIYKLQHQPPYVKIHCPKLCGQYKNRLYGREN